MTRLSRKAIPLRRGHREDYQGYPLLWDILYGASPLVILNEDKLQQVGTVISGVDESGDH